MVVEELLAAMAVLPCSDWRGWPEPCDAKGEVRPAFTTVVGTLLTRSSTGWRTSTAEDWLRSCTWASTISVDGLEVLSRSTTADSSPPDGTRAPRRLVLVTDAGRLRTAYDCTVTAKAVSVTRFRVHGARFRDSTVGDT